MGSSPDKKAKTNPPSLLDLPISAPPMASKEHDMPAFHTGVLAMRKRESSGSYDQKPSSAVGKADLPSGSPMYGGGGGYQGAFKRRKLADGTELVDAECGECPVPECNNQQFASAVEMRTHWNECHERQDLYTYYCSSCVFDASLKYVLKGHMRN